MWLAVWQAARIDATMAPVPPTVLIVDDHPSFRGTARALLEKPFQPELLLRRVRELLDAAGQAVPRADASPARTIE